MRPYLCQIEFITRFKLISLALDQWLMIENFRKRYSINNQIKLGIRHFRIDQFDLENEKKSSSMADVRWPGYLGGSSNN